MIDPFYEDWRNAVAAAFQYHKNLADRAVAQLEWDALRRSLDDNTNSIAVVMKHVAGNLISRWTDFLTTDGEKPWRNRDEEFVDRFVSREELAALWERGWATLFDSLNLIDAEACRQTVQIRGESLTAPLAVERSLAHTSYHVGQIVLLARHWAGENWQTLTVPRGASAAFNQSAWGSGDYRERSTVRDGGVAPEATPQDSPPQSLSGPPQPPAGSTDL